MITPPKSADTPADKRQIEAATTALVECSGTCWFECCAELDEPGPCARRQGHSGMCHCGGK